MVLPSSQCIPARSQPLVWLGRQHHRLTLCMPHWCAWAHACTRMCECTWLPLAFQEPCSFVHRLQPLAAVAYIWQPRLVRNFLWVAFPVPVPSKAIRIAPAVCMHTNNHAVCVHLAHAGLYRQCRWHRPWLVHSRGCPLCLSHHPGVRVQGECAEDERGREGCDCKYHLRFKEGAPKAFQISAKQILLHDRYVQAERDRLTFLAAWRSTNQRWSPWPNPLPASVACHVEWHLRWALHPTGRCARHGGGPVPPLHPPGACATLLLLRHACLLLCHSRPRLQALLCSCSSHWALFHGFGLLHTSATGGPLVSTHSRQRLRI